MPSPVNNTSAFFCPIRCAARMPTLLVVTVVIRAAQRMGQKKALVLFTGLGIFFQLLLIVVLMQDNINTVTFNLKHFNTSAFFCPIRCAAGTL